MAQRLYNGLGVAFDLEGTLVDLEQIHFMAFQRGMRSLGHRMLAEEVAELPGALGGGDPYIAHMLSERTGCDKGEILSHKGEQFDVLLREHVIAPRPFAAEFIEHAIRLGFGVAIGSLTPRRKGEFILKRSGLMGYFPKERIVFREDVREPKPHPAVYQETARRLGCTTKSQLVFEDSPAGIRAATSAGSCAIAVPSPSFQEEGHLRNLTDAGAKSVALSWQDMLATLLQHARLMGV